MIVLPDNGTTDSIATSTTPVLEVDVSSTSAEVSAVTTKIDINNNNYVLSSGGIYDPNYTGTTPDWLRSAIDNSVINSTTGFNGKVSDLSNFIASLRDGVNTSVLRIDEELAQQNALVTTVKSELDSNTAAIYTALDTKVTPDEASAIATTLIASEFGGGTASAWFLENISTYANELSASAVSITNLIAVYDDLEVRQTISEGVFAGNYNLWDGVSPPELGDYKIVDGVKYVYSTGFNGPLGDGWIVSPDDVAGWASGASNFVTDPTTGAITGWSYAVSEDGESEFIISADKFKVANITAGQVSEPVFEVDTNGEITMTGKVTINGMPENITKHAGDFASEAELLAWLAANTWFVPAPGDTYRNTTTGLVYIWDGVSAFVATRTDTDYLSIIFKRSKTPPLTPSGGDYDNPVPVGWSDGIPATDPAKDAQDPVWWTAFKFNSGVDYVANPPVWGTPVIAADTEVTDYMYNDSTAQPINPTYTGDLTSVSTADAANGWYNNANITAKWAAFRSKSEGSWSLWSVYQIKGEDGAPGLPGTPGAPGSRGTSVLTYNGVSSAFDSVTASGLFSGGPIAGDQVIWATSYAGGTRIYKFNGTTWGDDTALYIDGSVIITGTLGVDRISSGVANLSATQSFTLGANLSGVVQAKTTSGSVNGAISGESYGGPSNPPTIAASNHSTGHALYGYSWGGTGVYGFSGTGYAGDFNGKVKVRGDLEIGTTGGSSAVYVNGNLVNLADNAAVTSFNTRTGAVTLSSADVTGALGFTPANSSGNITTSNISSQSVNYANSAGSASNAVNAGYATTAGSASTANTAYAYGSTDLSISGTMSATAGYSGGPYAGSYVSTSGTVYASGSITTATGFWVGGTQVAFTGGHIGFTHESLIEGDVIYDSDIHIIDINQTYGKLTATTTAYDTRVVGVVSKEYVTDYQSILDMISLDRDQNILPEYVDFIDFIITNGYRLYRTNSIGEGLVNVCSENGNISAGDFICSSNTLGKAMKQDDGILHNYTVGKARESVDWSAEPSTTKMIACTYHCG